MQKTLSKTPPKTFQETLSEKILILFDNIPKAPEYVHKTKMLLTPKGRSLVAITARTPRVAEAASLTGWPTPNTPSGGPNATSTPNHTGGMDLEGAVMCSGWLTPSANEDAAGNPGAKMQPMLGSQAKLVISGQTQSPTSAKTESCGVLNPAFSRWLQGYPYAWDTAAILAYRSKVR